LSDTTATKSCANCSLRFSITATSLGEYTGETLDELTGPGDPELAARFFCEALKLDPTMADAYNGLAQIAE